MCMWCDERVREGPFQGVSQLPSNPPTPPLFVSRAKIVMQMRGFLLQCPLAALARFAYQGDSKDPVLAAKIGPHKQVHPGYGSKFVRVFTSRLAERRGVWRQRREEQVRPKKVRSVSSGGRGEKGRSGESVGHGTGRKGREERGRAPQCLFRPH